MASYATGVYLQMHNNILIIHELHNGKCFVNWKSGYKNKSTSVMKFTWSSPIDSSLTGKSYLSKQSLDTGCEILLQNGEKYSYVIHQQLTTGYYYSPPVAMYVTRRNNTLKLNAQRGKKTKDKLSVTEPAHEAKSPLWHRFSAWTQASPLVCPLPLLFLLRAGPSPFPKSSDVARICTENPCRQNNASCKAWQAPGYWCIGKSPTATQFHCLKSAFVSIGYFSQSTGTTSSGVSKIHTHSALSDCKPQPCRCVRTHNAWLPGKAGVNSEVKPFHSLIFLGSHPTGLNPYVKPDNMNAPEAEQFSFSFGCWAPGNTSTVLTAVLLCWAT